MKLKIKKNDIVEVIAGDDKGKSGRVLLVDPKKMTVLIEGVNIHVRHEKPSQRNQNGGRIEKEFPIHYSNVLVIDSDKNATRVGFRKETKGTETSTVRYSKKNNKVI
ncbi:MAG: 50S ribosomal protein L24 [Candidatus Kapabacteria bacterium]|nr:50S ribosomal protein L24 [Ignavibacteriota bacterium]MCW5884031.1 50S ribosomal protein L24 [Candidatus Kapabacteria bacterium]